MKKCSFVLTLSLLFALQTVMAQSVTADSTGLPGDQFSLPGALELFKKATSPEEFEKLLNSEGNDVNNLDLNADGDIDYIKVIDKQDGDVHAFVLQVPVSESENQDIAVIELEKTGENTAMLQIVGDEDIFGEETIVEPGEESSNGTAYLRSESSFAHGPQVEMPQPGVIVNVWFWPTVRFVYAPAYRVWVSPWSWRHRPIWWRPWRPVAYRVFYPRRIVYAPRYMVVTTHRVIRAHRVYQPYRTTSVTVRTRNQAGVTRYRNTQTYRGRHVDATRRTTTVEGPRGNKVKRTKTTVRKHRR